MENVNVPAFEDQLYDMSRDAVERGLYQNVSTDKLIRDVTFDVMTMGYNLTCETYKALGQISNYQVNIDINDKADDIIVEIFFKKTDEVMIRVNVYYIKEINVS